LSKTRRKAEILVASSIFCVTASIAEFPMKCQSKKKVSNLVVKRICIVVIHIWNTPVVVIKDSSYAMVFYLLIIFINEECMFLYYLEIPNNLT
jgi:hypothetical protein